MAIDPHQIAQTAYGLWKESLERHDDSYLDYLNPQVGDLVLEITVGAMALEEGIYMPSCLGWLDSDVTLFPVRLRQMDGTVSEWATCQFVKVPSDLWPQR